jgi:hypothetical protein
MVFAQNHLKAIWQFVFLILQGWHFELRGGGLSIDGNRLA